MAIPERRFLVRMIRGLLADVDVIVWLVRNAIKHRPRQGARRRKGR
jgi:hypothetical protein